MHVRVQREPFDVAAELAAQRNIETIAHAYILAESRSLWRWT